VPSEANHSPLLSFVTSIITLPSNPQLDGYCTINRLLSQEKNKNNFRAINFKINLIFIVKTLDKWYIWAYTAY
jgi:hypothetical protein